MYLCAMSLMCYWYADGSEIDPVLIAVVILAFEQHLFLLDVVLGTSVSFQLDINLCVDACKRG